MNFRANTVDFLLPTLGQALIRLSGVSEDTEDFRVSVLDEYRPYTIFGDCKIDECNVDSDNPDSTNYFSSEMVLVPGSYTLEADYLDDNNNVLGSASLSFRVIGGISPDSVEVEQTWTLVDAATGIPVIEDIDRLSGSMIDVTAFPQDVDSVNLVIDLEIEGEGGRCIQR